ncbi:hypothetical protein CBM2634_A100338 [Cupriavidus taiwanensis]|uniref:Uncharacterized protein n=1 Tax=Cupriavidus taiwanensis TaxID=164546 RepID=A0A375IXW2_9BURK|nr:hypothetical protein CBM2634_A100338 [Cupriavidus taiwanensis]
MVEGDAGVQPGQGSPVSPAMARHCFAFPVPPLRQRDTVSPCLYRSLTELSLAKTCAQARVYSEEVRRHLYRLLSR